MRDLDLRGSDLLLLGVAAGHWPLGVMARNHWQVVHPERAAILILAVVVVAALIALLLMKIPGVDRPAAVFTVFVATIVLMRGGGIVSAMSPTVGWLILISVIALAGFVGARFSGHPALEIAGVSLAVLLASGPLISLVLSVQGFGEDNVADSHPFTVELEDKPDIFLIFLDAYPGLIALDQGFGDSRELTSRALSDRGFQIPESAWTAYWSTETAIPSILQMSYPMEAGLLSPATRQHLHRIIGGDNNLVQTLEGNGYQTVMVEPGWTGSGCGEQFDRCVESPWLDDLAYVVLWEGVMRVPILRRYGHAYTMGVQATMESLESLARQDDVDDNPRFVMAHLIAPHGPFFLDETCQTLVSQDRIGDEFYAVGVDPVIREGFFFEQMDCVDRFMVEFGRLVDNDDVVVFVSDHGSGRLGGHLEQTIQTRETVVERMNVFAAIRVREGCDIGDSVVTVNLMRRVLSCYSEAPLDDVVDRIFLPGWVELAPGEVDDLVADRARPGYGLLGTP